MNYHVFIVDRITFKYHLEYMFAGTGAGDKTVPFISDCEASIHSTTERNLVGMIADISRIRENDKIIFYLQSANGKPGMFYGVFAAASKGFLDENDASNYLKDKLYKSLTFRVKIKADCVYPKGISEHEYLDSLENIEHPYQMCWSLIYRKLKGNRGCTMITDYEFRTLVEKLKAVNDDNCFAESVSAFSFNSDTYCIESSGLLNNYGGRTNDLDIKSRMLYKANGNKAFEVHLQAFIMQNFDIPLLDGLLIPCLGEECWIGNEVSCGVGMQRIDTMLVQEVNDDVFIKVIELKCIAPYMDILRRQLPWYITWITEYVAPNYTSVGKKVHIIPCVIAQKSTNDEFIDSCRDFHQGYNGNDLIIEPAEYIGFEIDENDIIFSKIV